MLDHMFCHIMIAINDAHQSGLQELSTEAVHQFTLGQRRPEASLYLQLEEFSNWNDSYFNLLMIVSSFCGADSVNDVGSIKQPAEKGMFPPYLPAFGSMQHKDHTISAPLNQRKAALRLYEGCEWV